MKIIVSFSGGKDSQACLIQAAKQYGSDKIEAVFCDTGWEHPLTYQHINAVCQQLDVKLTIIRNEKVGGFQNLCKQMKCFPVASRRVCTSVLKIQPMIDWIISQDENLEVKKVYRVQKWSLNVPISRNILVSIKE